MPSTFQTAPLVDDVGRGGNCSQGDNWKRNLHRDYTFASTGRSVHIDLCNPGGQEGAGVNWQRCRGESGEEWHRPENIFPQATQFS